MIGYNPIGHVNEVWIIGSNLTSIRACSRNLLNGIEKWNEYIGVIIGINTLEDGSETFESHTGVDMLGRQRTERPVSFPIELNEDIVPYFNNIGTIGIDEGGGITSTDTIIVDFLQMKYTSVGRNKKG